jgi:hypothetical protein
MVFAVNFRPYFRLALLVGVGLLVIATIVGNWRTFAGL